MSSSDPTMKAPTELRPKLGPAVDRLLVEFRETVPEQEIRRVMAESYASLATARVSGYVPVLAERFARERLRALAHSRGAVADGKLVVVFLCVHNAGRSQMAAGWARHLGADRIEVFSGGSGPSSMVNPSAVDAMAEVGIDIASEFPKRWTDEVIAAADVIVTMGCGDSCPIFPGKRYVDWSLADPAGLPLEEVRPIRDEIGRRVRELLNELSIPFETMTTRR